MRTSLFVAHLVRRIEALFYSKKSDLFLKNFANMREAVGQAIHNDERALIVV